MLFIVFHVTTSENNASVDNFPSHYHRTSIAHEKENMAAVADWFPVTSWYYVTARLSPVSVSARHLTQPEVKIQVFKRLKSGGEKSLSQKFFAMFISGPKVDSNKQIKIKICHIHFKPWVNFILLATNWRWRLLWKKNNTLSNAENFPG